MEQTSVVETGSDVDRRGFFAVAAASAATLVVNGCGALTEPPPDSASETTEIATTWGPEVLHHGHVVQVGLVVHSYFEDTGADSLTPKAKKKKKCKAVYAKVKGAPAGKFRPLASKELGTLIQEFWFESVPHNGTEDNMVRQDPEPGHTGIDQDLPPGEWVTTLVVILRDRPDPIRISIDEQWGD